MVFCWTPGKIDTLYGSDQNNMITWSPALGLYYMQNRSLNLCRIPVITLQADDLSSLYELRINFLEVIKESSKQLHAQS